MLSPKQETTDVVNLDPSHGEDHAAVTYDLSCDNNPRHPQVSCEKRLAGGSSNPFAIKKVIDERQSPSGAATPINEEGLPLNQVKPHRGGGHKLLSLKDRKRKHRTLSISPQSAESCSKKVCNGAAKNENIHPNSTDHQNLIPSGNVLRRSKRVEEDGERVKVSDASQLSCEFTTEEAALMQGYALDSERSHAEKLSLADLDLNAKPPASSSVKNQTPSKDHLLSKANRSGLSSIPCSPSFSPRKPAPKAFSPFFERTRPTSTDGKEEDRLLTHSHIQASESVENSFESSAVLFSTPAAMESSQSALSSHSVSKSLPRRTLNFNEPDKQAPVHPASPIYQVNETIFPSTARLSPSSSSSSVLPPAEILHQASASNDDFSFIGDISLSEFADVSRIEMEAEASSTVKTSKTFPLNRHLVLEVTSQESSSEDAILCTGR